MSTRAEVAIAGGGPGGVATAVALVRADPSLRGKVIVVDRARFPRAKPCGGGLTGHADQAMAALGLALDVPSIASPRATVRYGSYRREVALGKPVKVVRREEFDASLVAQARDLGVVVREKTAMVDFSVEKEQVRVGLSGGEDPLLARVLVGADGAGSLVRKRLGGAREGRTIRLFRAEMPAKGMPSDAMLYDFSPMVDGLAGYLWIFPVAGDRVNVGLMHYPSPKSPLAGGQLSSLLRARLAEHGVELPENVARGWPAWSYHPSREVAAPRLLTVGDAAGIDALTGEGIAVAMEHGLCAATAITTALSTGDFRFRGYRRALRRATVGRELALDRWLAKLLYEWRGNGRWLSLVLYDRDVLQLYAARVSGTMVLADHKLDLFRALGRHLFRGPERRRALAGAALPALPAAKEP